MGRARSVGAVLEVLRVGKGEYLSTFFVVFEENLSETFVEMRQPSVILSFSRPRLSFSVLARDFDALRLVVFLIR
jgi:hypothetical protein